MNDPRVMTYQEWLKLLSDKELEDLIVECDYCNGTGDCHCESCDTVAGCHECIGSGEIDTSIDVYNQQVESDLKKWEEYHR